MSSRIECNEQPNTAVAPVVLRERTVIALTGFTMMLVVMNTMMFNFALPSVATQFALSPATTSWIVTGYSIVFAISSITYSRLSDYLPLRTLVTVALLSLGGASLMGAFSAGFWTLLGARLIQATGAGAIPSIGIILFTRYIPLSRRGVAMALLLSAASLGLGLGPVVGGAIVQYLGWHFLFAVTGTTLLLVPAFLWLVPRERAVRGSFDLIGALLLGIGATGMLLFLTNERVWTLAIGIAALSLFVLRIRRATNPFVLPALFSDKRYMSLAAIGVGAYMVSFAFLYIAPQILARVFTLSPGASGLVLFPGALLAMLVSRRLGRIIDRHGNHALLAYLPWLLLGSVAVLALTAVHSFYALAAVYVVVSVSFTAISSAVSNELSRVLHDERVGSGMGLFQLLQFFSGALAVALSGSALVWQKALPVGRAYDNLIWGMAVVATLVLISAAIYRRSTKQSIAMALPVLVPGDK